ncbi:MAG: extracellular solute-binding protein [Spirochaetaceae bacterium]|nr:MAG: extracellular solute-binding protein [Spirochaetaceae bacterium]
MSIKRLGMSLLVAVCVPATLLWSAGTREAAAEALPVVTQLVGQQTHPAANNSVMQEVARRTGVDWRPTVVTEGEDHSARLSAMIAARTLPDFFTVNIGLGDQLVASGLLKEMSGLIAEYGSNVAEAAGDALHTGLNTREEVWGIPSPAVYAARIAVRKDWLDNLGMSVPQTLEEFSDVLHAFTFKDPNRSGRDDTIGLGVRVGAGADSNFFVGIFAAFGVPYMRPILKDGVVTSHMMHENYLDAVRYLRRLYREGVMEPDFATIPQLPLFEKLWNGAMGAIDFFPNGTTQNWIGRYREDPKPVFEYTVIKGPDGVGGTLRMHSNVHTVLAASAKHPVEAMKLADYFHGFEGQVLLFFGIEGKHFRWVDRANYTHEHIPPYNDAATLRGDGGWVYYNPWRRAADNFEILILNDQTRRAVNQGYDLAIDDAYIYRPTKIEQELGTTLRDIEMEALATLIVTEDDLERVYRRFVERWLASGGRDYQVQATEIYEQERGL